MTQSSQKSKKVSLISAPWPLYNRPSIQLGALKAYLQSIYPGLGVDARHFYLELAETIGYKLYHSISERTWIAESIYAALLYPERFEVVEKLFKREVRSKPILKKAGENREVKAQSSPVSHECIANAQAVINVSRKRLCNCASK